MANNSDVTVIIDMLKPTPRIGFGLPLILGSSTAGSSYKKYADLAAVAVDFIASTEEYKAAAALFAQGDNAPAEIAIITRKTGATAETVPEVMARALLYDWYFIVATTSLLADVQVIAAAVEANANRMYFTRSSNKADVATLKASNYTRTTAFYHTTITNYPEAALIGRCGAAPVGSLTWKGKTLVGILPLSLTATELNDIHTAGAITYLTKAGTNVTSEGKTLSGEYIDIIHSKDYVKASIEFGVQDLINHTDKIPYDDTGIAQIESVVRTVLQRAYNQGIIASDADGLPLFTTKFKTRAEVDAADRAARKYNDGSFSFDLAGAIHETTIRGLIRL